MYQRTTSFILCNNMQYKQFSITITYPELSDMIVARLSDIGFDGFEETAGTLFAYRPATDFDAQEVETVLSEYGLTYTINDIEEQNWNAQWEESFQPVVVPGFCTVRAHFHDIDVSTEHDIIITPQMSFGTGHHATTMLMMQQMQHIDMRGKTVFDFGTGTGILAILAEKLMARGVIAVDNDSWSYENAIDNVKRNGCNNIIVLHGSLEDVRHVPFDIILANINRHILLAYMGPLYDLLAAGGTMLMSGLLKEDIEIIKPAIESAGFKLESMEELNGWIVLLIKR